LVTVVAELIRFALSAAAKISIAPRGLVRLAGGVDNVPSLVMNRLGDGDVDAAKGVDRDVGAVEVSGIKLHRISWRRRGIFRFH
jgi:hypothetical protein